MAEAQPTLDLWDYRRRVLDMYRQVRESPATEDTWRHWRRRRDQLFRTHPQSAVPVEERAAFQDLPYFPYDPAWRLEIEVEPLSDSDEVSVGHSGPGQTAFLRFGRARLEVQSQEASLTLYWLDSYGGGVFLPFRDATSGQETYGGGRYLLDTAKGADLGSRGSTVTLDFNYAYHPSCVHDYRWSCPLAPRENWLPVAVRAGERLA